jgi:hypothetical protein
VRSLVLSLTAGSAILLAGSSGAGAPPSEYLGADGCGTCHAVAHEAWSAGPHARALSSLSATRAGDPACRACHTLAPDRDDPALAGVQCEACHGAGREYAPGHVMRDPVLARLLGLQDVEEATCLVCHRPDTPSATPFRYVDAVQRVCVNRSVSRAATPKENP